MNDFGPREDDNGTKGDSDRSSFKIIMVNNYPEFMFEHYIYSNYVIKRVNSYDTYR